MKERQDQESIFRVPILARDASEVEVGDARQVLDEERAEVSFILDHGFTLGVSETLLEMTLVMPSTALPKRLIMNETEPRQWQTTWTRRPWPTAAHRFETLPDSRTAMSSMLWPRLR